MARSRTIGTFDPETGELLGRIEVVLPRKIRFGEDWIMVMQEAMDLVSRDRTLGWEAGRMFMFILGHADFENWFRLPHKEIGEHMGMRPANVSRAMKTLVDRGLLVRGPRLAGGYVYRVNSHAAWKGRVHNLQAHRAAVAEPRLRLVHGAQASG